ncbi:KTSC domain-containing protein [Neolewinella xylanilytica]|nr:KTSC domain-containing protein [Neolewinella xylanilytica]
MQNHLFGKDSEIVSKAHYNPDTETLFLTYLSGPTTIAYRNVPVTLYNELLRSAYPDVCIRFKIQARHPFRRVGKSYGALNYTFMK